MSDAPQPPQPQLLQVAASGEPHPHHPEPEPDALTAPTALTGAQFRRAVGIDPEAWARRFLSDYARADAVRTDADRLAFVAGWFRSAMRAAVSEACHGQDAR